MSVTPSVPHVEIWPYVASVAVGFDSHAATAVLIVVSSATSGVTVGAGVVVGARDGAGEGPGVVGVTVGAGVAVGTADVGMGVGAQPPFL